jgi:hypothetical protein
MELKKCPCCDDGELHQVGNEGEEVMLWCNKCDTSVDSDGGVIN